MLSEVQSKDRVRGRTKLHERVSTTNENENPKEVRPTGYREEKKVA